MGKHILDEINKRKDEARSLDAGLVKQRAPYVSGNLKQIEGINRSNKYVHRLAGISTDIYRKSRNEMLVEWFGATAIENYSQAMKFKSFWQSMFDYADDISIVPRRDFWTTEEDTNNLLSQLRISYLAGNRIDTRNALLQIIQNAKEMLKQIDQMEEKPQFFVNK